MEKTINKATPYKDTPWESIKRKYLNRVFQPLTQEK